MGKQRRQRRRRKKCADELANGIVCLRKKKDRKRKRRDGGVYNILYWELLLQTVKRGPKRFLLCKYKRNQVLKS